MRSTTVFFILGLLVLARASEDTAVFAELDQHPFGATLLDLVQINMQANSQTEMKSEDSINQISDLLNQIQADMRSNKKTADSDHKTYQDNADFAIANYKKVIARQEARKVATEKKLAADRKALADAKADLAAAQKHLAQLVAKIASIDAENVKALARYNKKVSELNDAVSACKEAVVELNKLQLGAFAQGAEINMLQIKGGMQKVELALQLHLPARLTLYQPIITALVDMGTNADPALVKKVVSLINELRNALEAELSSTHKTEKQRSADYRKYRSDLVSDKVATEARIGRDLSLIKKLEGFIRSNEALLAKLVKLIANNKALLATRVAQKAAEQAAYVRDNKVRESELKVVGQLISFFQERFAAGMSSYLRKRVARM